MPVGTSLVGRYRLAEEIGAGGIGVVYRATDVRTRATVAIKVLHQRLARDPDSARRFHRGARVARRLHSPHVVRVLGDGRDGDRHFVVMEFIAGNALSQVIRQRGRLPTTDVQSIAEQMASALDAAHRLGIVHRDIKPGNILFSADGSAKLTDFDTAWAADVTRMTRTGAFLGSVHYAAPEAVLGRADVRSDIYSLGVVLYELLLGHLPFEGETPLKVVELHRTMDPPDLDELERLGGALGHVIRQCLAKRQEDRFQGPRPLLAALRGTALADPGPGARMWPRRRLPYVIVAVGATAAVATAITWANVTPSGDGTQATRSSTEKTAQPKDPPVATPTNVPALAIALPADPSLTAFGDIPIPQGAAYESGTTQADIHALESQRDRCRQGQLEVCDATLLFIPGGPGCSVPDEVVDEPPFTFQEDIQFSLPPATIQQLVGFYRTALADWELKYDDQPDMMIFQRGNRRVELSFLYSDGPSGFSLGHCTR